MYHELPDISYFKAETLESAVNLLTAHADTAKLLAGGTDILGLLKDRKQDQSNNGKTMLLDINHIQKLKKIEHRGHEIYIGGAVSLEQINNSELIRTYAPIAAQAAASVGTTQLRNMGSIAGNLCQRPRCMYFRHRAYPCYKKGGKRCYAPTGEHRDYHAIFNPGKCRMAHPSDTAPALTTLHAECLIRNTDGTRRIPISKFFNGPNSVHDTVLKENEILQAVIIPDTYRNAKQIFLKQAPRRSVDFALVSVACILEIKDKLCTNIHLVLGGTASKPEDISAEIAFAVGSQLDAKAIDAISEAAVNGARPLPQNEYKIELAKGLIRKAITALI